MLPGREKGDAFANDVLLLLLIGVQSCLTFPLPGYPPNPGIEPESLASPGLAGGFFTISTSLEALDVLLLDK